MRSQTQFFSTFLTILLLVGCGPGAPTAPTEYDRQVYEANRKNQEQIDKMKQESERIKKKIAEQGLATTEQLLDTLGKGGQPGDVSLSGNLIEASSLPDAKVRVTRVAGRNWRGIVAPLSSPDVRQIETPRVVVIAPPTRTYINAGCDLSARSDLRQFKELPIAKQPDKVTHLRAQFVFACGKPDLGTRGLNISAKTLVLANFEYELSASSGGFPIWNDDGLDAVNFSATELQISGINQVTTRSISSASLLQDAAAPINILTANVAGDGVLNIASYGLDRKKATEVVKTP